MVEASEVFVKNFSTLASRRMVDSQTMLIVFVLVQTISAPIIHFDENVSRYCDFGDHTAHRAWLTAQIELG